MKRRDFITLLGGAATAWPLAAHAQTKQMRLIGMLLGGLPDDPMLQQFITAFRDSLAKLGWIENRNVRIEIRWVAGDSGRTPASSLDLAAMNPDIVLTNNTPILQELQKQTRKIPLVFVSLADPVESAVVTSLAHPGGNTTGFMNPEASMSGKWVELLKELARASSECWCW
jgi:putative ABC transport system substrate-binding protein